MKFQTILTAFRRSIELGRMRQSLVFERRLERMWQRRRGASAVCPANVERAVEMVSSGVSVPNAAAKEDVDINALLYEIQRRGGLGELRPRLSTGLTRRESKETQKGLSRVRRGMPVAQAAAESGATPAAIRSAIARRGGLAKFLEDARQEREEEGYEGDW